MWSSFEARKNAIFQNGFRKLVYRRISFCRLKKNVSAGRASARVLTLRNKKTMPAVGAYNFFESTGWLDTMNFHETKATT